MGKYLDIAKQALESQKSVKEQKHDLIRDMLKELNTTYTVELFQFVVGTPELVKRLDLLDAEIHEACIDDDISPEKFNNEQVKQYLDLHVKAVKAYEQFKNAKRTTYLTY